MSGEAADVVLRKFGNEQLPENRMATEKQIKTAFLICGYGPRAIDKWWNVYRNAGIIQVVTKGNIPVTNDNYEKLYTTIYWLPPVVE